MTQSVISGVLAAAVAPAGTFTASYPTGKTKGAFLLAMGHKLIINQAMLYFPDDIGITLNAGNITVTNNTSGTWPIGATFRLDLKERGERQYANTPEGYPNQVTQPLGQANIRRSDRSLLVSAVKSALVEVDLGMPATASAVAVAAAQLFGGAGTFTLTSSPFVMDVPRNFTLTVATTNHSARTITVIGTDVYGNPMRENLAGPNNNTVSGIKAFKTITSATVDGAVATNGISIGFGTTLGIPVFVPSGGYVVKELQDGAVATAGTLAAGIRVKSTATTGDVRGTYIPNSAPNGALCFGLVLALADPGNIGISQFNG